MALTMKQDILKVFLPCQCLISAPGYLLGVFLKESNFVCITGIVHKASNGKIFDPKAIRNKETIDIKLIGKWSRQENNSNLNDNILLNGRNDIWITLEERAPGLPTCSINDDFMVSNGLMSMTVVVFDVTSLLVSKCITDRYDNYQGANSKVLQCLVHCLQIHQKTMKDVALGIKAFKTDDIITHFVEPGPVKSEFSWDVMTAVHKLFLFLVICGKKIGTSRLFNNKVTEYIFGLLSSITQLQLKYRQLNQAVMDTREESHSHFRYKNVVSLLILDIMVGLLCMLWISSGSRTEFIANWMMAQADHVSTQLNALLKWMMGFPAGLKLNSQLDELLGKFFLYHIYLWTGYLSLLRPVLSQMLLCISYMGCVGFTVQLCLLRDLVSMATLHIYCFYVYAAKLYHLQVSVLGSLWRLFRGKKWNILRHRVDSASYDVDQLFIGTLLFTILLFLLPTTTLYYVVFMALRLLVIAFQGTLFKAVLFINSFPIYSIMLRIIHSQQITGDICIGVLKKATNDPLYLTCAVIHLPISKVYGMFRLSMQKSDVYYTWKEFGKRLIVGELVYPWVEREE